MILSVQIEFINKVDGENIIKSPCKLLAGYFSWEQRMCIDLMELSHCLRFEFEGKKEQL